MRNIRKIVKWFLNILSILIIFMLGILFIFLFRPQLFIHDIELFIESKISTNTSGNFDIGLFEGNFIKGFKMTNVQFHKNGDIIFSAGEMYIDPDLSHIFIGDVVLSEVIIHNAYYYQHTKLNILEEGISPMYYKFPKLNYEISSLVIDTSIIIYEGELYKLHGRLKIAFADKIIIGFDNFIINSPSFTDNIVIPSGSLSFNSEEIIFEDAKIISDWIDGGINAKINYKDYGKSHGNMIFETIFIPLNDSTKFNAKNINLTLNNIDNLSELTMTGTFIFQNFQLDSMSIQGFLRDKYLSVDDSKFEFMNNNIVAKGILNLEKLNWNASIFLNGFTYGELDRVSGNVNIESPFLFENIKGQLDLTNIQIDSLIIDSVKGEFRYSKDKSLTADLIILSNGYMGSVKILPFTDQNNYKMSGNIEFNEFDISKYNKLIRINNISGNINFTVHRNNGISKIEFISESGKSDLLNTTCDTYRGKTSLIVNDNIITGRSDGYLNKCTVGPYNWQKIEYHVTIQNSNLLICDIYLNGELGDTLTIEATTESSDIIYISKLEGSLKQTDIYVEPFFIKLDRERIIVPKIYVEVDAGLITLSGNYEYHGNYDLDGTVENIDLKNIYSIIGKTFQINGKIMKSQFHIKNNIIDNKDNPLTYFDILIYNGEWDEIGFDSLILSTSYSDRRFMISKCKLQTPLGYLDAEGWFNRGFTSGTPRFIPQDQFNIIMTFDHFQIDKFNRYLPWGFESKGFLTGNAKITGVIDDLEILGNIMIKSPSFDRIKGDSLSASLTYKKHRLFFDNLILSTRSGTYYGAGSIPIKLNISQRDTLCIENMPIDFFLTGKTNSIEFIPPYFNVIDSISGLNITDHSFTMSLGITGNLSNPVRNGEFIIDNATVYLNPLEIPVENINGRLKVIDNRLIIDYLTGRLIKKEPTKKFSITNIFKKDKGIIKENLKIMGSINLDYFFNPDFSIQIEGDDIYLNSSYNLFHGSGFANVYITGRDTVLINGQFHPTPNEFTITSLGDETFYGTEVSNNNLYIYNIHVPFEDGIQLKTDDINVLLDGDVTFSKSGRQNFIYSGKVNIIAGKFYDNQGNMYEDMSGSIFLSPDKNASHLDIHSIISINTSIIDVSILGNPHNPVIHFSDNEGRYNQTELLSLLAFGNAEFSNAPDQVENIFSNYFENQIERSISRATSLDEFQLKSTGSLLNVMEGQEDIDIKLIIGKRLSNRMYINTQIDFRNFNENQYEAVYQLSRNTSIVGGLNSSAGNNSLHLKYRIKYYY